MSNTTANLECPQQLLTGAGFLRLLEALKAWLTPDRRSGFGDLVFILRLDAGKATSWKTRNPRVKLKRMGAG